MHTRALTLALCVATLPVAQWAHAADATGIWIDHTGRGAVEIVECGANLCGKVVWLKEGVNKKGCGVQIIGNAKPVGKDTWDGGWIYDPDKNEKYSVELKPIGTDKLRVLGYMGSKFFSETMIWKRAATDLKRCDDPDSSVTVAPAPSEKKAPPAEASPKAPAKEAEQKPAKGKAKTSDQAEGCKRYLPQTGQMIAVPCEK